MATPSKNPAPTGKPNRQLPHFFCTFAALVTETTQWSGFALSSFLASLLIQAAPALPSAGFVPQTRILLLPTEKLNSILIGGR